MLNNNVEISWCLQPCFELSEGLNCCVQHNIHLLAASLFTVHGTLTLKQQGHSCPKRKHVKLLLNSRIAKSCAASRM